MYVRTYVRMYVRMYVYMCVCTYVCEHAQCLPCQDSEAQEQRSGSHAAGLAEMPTGPPMT